MSYAFRPFFLLNGLFAIAVIVIWLMALHGIKPTSVPANMVYWHGHEMVVGFSMAAMAGFVLTAVATWTDRQPRDSAALLAGCFCRYDFPFPAGHSARAGGGGRP
jgi:uncharacterized protein involved in response to NO